VQVEPSHLDIPSSRYNFSKFSTTFHFLEKENKTKNQNGPKLNRPTLLLPFWPAKWPSQARRGNPALTGGSHPSYSHRQERSSGEQKLTAGGSSGGTKRTYGLLVTSRTSAYPFPQLYYIGSNTTVTLVDDGRRLTSTATKMTTAR
jgi:hypothetical protein